jgi:hypothetical protein
MLTFGDLKTQPDGRRFWHLAVLTGLRDGAERVELRIGEGDATLYHRVGGRDWELAVVDEGLFPHLKPALRELSRLVSPERPDFRLTTFPVASRVEPAEVGWLTGEVGGHLFDFVVRIDPQEPYGLVTVELDVRPELAAAAADLLADYYAEA